jgi:hypothetical protein
MSSCRGTPSKGSQAGRLLHSVRYPKRTLSDPRYARQGGGAGRLPSKGSQAGRLRTTRSACICFGSTAGIAPAAASQSSTDDRTVRPGRSGHCRSGPSCGHRRCGGCRRWPRRRGGGPSRRSAPAQSAPSSSCRSGRRFAAPPSDRCRPAADQAGHRVSQAFCVGHPGSSFEITMLALTRNSGQSRRLAGGRGITLNLLRHATHCCNITIHYSVVLYK